MFRKTLKAVLGFLSRWAIRKHKMEIIVVAGFAGTEVVREGIYQILKEKFRVRQNTDRIKWDMSIPLAVLGYKDKKRNALEWIILLSKAIVFLALGPSNEHTLVLSANCKYSETAKFWSSFLSPDYFVVLSHPDESLLVENIFKNLNSEKTKVIYDKGKIRLTDIDKYQFRSSFSFGEKTNKAKLSYDSNTGELIYRQKKLKMPTVVPQFAYSFFAAIFATAINHHVPFEHAAIEALKFDLGVFLSSRIKETLDRSD